MKRIRTSSSSDSSDNESPSTSFCSTNKYGSKPGTPACSQKKPAEVFRKDLISAMKLPDSHHISAEDYYLLADTWRQEWEKGVQVPASPDTVLEPSVRIIAEKPKEILYTRPKKYFRCWSQDATEMGYVNINKLAEDMCRYDLDDTDLHWLHTLNTELLHMGEGAVDELTVERALEALERQCHGNMRHAIETVEGLGIEYDEDVICDVCRSPDSEEGNDMVFCDKCNICVHQACYGIVKVPVGNWLCRTCVLGLEPQCLLCPKKGGAMKATRAGTKWAHVSCALWIPEVSIACPERMEPITKVSHIPPSRWSLICSLCKLKTGACIQCSVKNCTTPFHVTCAFEQTLEMKTILDEGDEVKFKSYCLKHSRSKTPGAAAEPGLSPARPKPVPTETEKVGLRAQRLRELEEEFHTLIQPGELARDLGVAEPLMDFIFQYWKLKRKTSFNRALLPPKEEEGNLLVQPQEDSIHTRMRMFMHLRQDLERVRNLCYMVSRREKLKLSQSKAQEQMFNLHIKLLNQEVTAGVPLSFPIESLLFHPPPRITLKLKMPKAQLLGNGKSSAKSGNGPLCPDNSLNVHEQGPAVVPGGLGLGKPQLHSRGRREERSNGLPPTSSSSSSSSSSSGHREANAVSSSTSAPAKPGSGKPLALHAALHSQHASNGKPPKPADAERRGPGGGGKANGLAERCVAQKDISCQTPGGEQGAPLAEALCRGGQPAGFRKAGMEHFSRSFKEATVSLVRSTEDLRGPDRLGRKSSSSSSSSSSAAKERLWPKPASSSSEPPPNGARSRRETDGYCPDAELSDSESEVKGRHRQRRGPKSPAPAPGAPLPPPSARGKPAVASRGAVQR
ncbi:protein Jade-3 [Gadus morhua]|uniref:protein Jade-3 n=1 Tax=Gadus morhua TaxID=8049 RepID=UPI0011B67C0F|nr:protein Jade-3 [Gadus morhua]XP_030228040.1 protein Jade-3 [Gadus morhua]